MSITLVILLIIQIVTAVPSEKDPSTTDIVEAFLAKKFGSVDAYGYKPAQFQTSLDKYNKRMAGFEDTNVIPLKQPRGVLDMLLPPERVQSFKSALDGFKKLLSYTFRR